MRRQTSLLAIVAISVALIAPTVMAANGTIRNLYPPGNNGTTQGVGEIEELDASGNGMGRPYFIFRTPNDVGGFGILAEGGAVTFDVVRGRKATNVVSEDPIPIPADGTKSAALGLLAIAGFCRARRRRRKCA